MPVTRAEKNVICPFFLRDTNLAIICEGIADVAGVAEVGTRLVFRNKEEKIEYLKAHCEKYNSKCIYASMITRLKYE